MYFLTIVVLCFLFLQTFGRPTHVLQDYDKDSRENSYRDSESDGSDDYLHSERKSSLKQFAGNEPVPKAELQYENDPSTNEEVDHARPDKDYLENNDKDQTDTARLSHDSPMGSDVKRTASYNNGILLFHDNEKPRKVQANEYIEDDKDESSQHARYMKEYNSLRNAERNSVTRNRRQIKNEYLSDNTGTDEISTQKNEVSVNEDEETAIRRHVKKLSKEELDELFHSLSEDKKSLLKNIIDNYQQEYDSINKREITKKAGANGENSLVGNEQSDASKIQGGSANLEAESSMAPNYEKEDSTKKADAESMYSKSSENANSSDKTSDKINVLDSITEKSLVKTDNVVNLESCETESKISGSSESEKETPKKENKREINSKPSTQQELIIEEPAILRSSNKDDSYCSENDDISHLWNEESSLYNDNNKFKREIYSEDFNSFKSLEESFPNPDDSNKPNSDLAPLVRVKRNNHDKQIAKRDATVLSNLKAPYFSSALENEEGSEERGEFQDEGFFERGANIAKSSELAKQGIDKSENNEKSHIKYCGNSQATHIDKNKLETDTVGLGSDTDVVLSGIEGVDDNIMYNSVARVRRTGDAFDNLNMENETDKQGNKQQIDSQSEDNEILEEDNNSARYQENDAFGSLPRNYEQDLGRFKRIRRLKPENHISTIK